MFRPCIDLHEGKVKQIVGGTLGDAGLADEFCLRTIRPRGSPGFTSATD